MCNLVLLLGLLLASIVAADEQNVVSFNLRFDVGNATRLGEVTAYAKSFFELTTQVTFQNPVVPVTAETWVTYQSDVIDVNALYIASPSQIGKVLTTVEQILKAKSSFTAPLVLSSNSNFRTSMTSSVFNTTMPCRSAGYTGYGICANGRHAVTRFAVAIQGIVAPNVLVTSFCQALSLSNCNNLVIVGAGTPTADGELTVFEIRNLGNALSSIVTMVDKVRTNNFVFSSFTINKVMLQSETSQATIYSSSEVLLSEVKPVTAQRKCTAEDYWWLMFLIVIIPITACLWRTAYRKGRSRGIEKERQDIQHKHFVAQHAVNVPHQQQFVVQAN